MKALLIGFVALLCGLGAAELLARFMIGSWMVWFYLGTFGVTYVQCAALSGATFGVFITTR